MKYVLDSVGTDFTTSSGPHGISLSTTMDDEVFMDKTFREADEKTPDSQEEVSERSMVKVSPGAVREEVSQAISDKKGMLIILKEVEDKEEGKEMSAAGDKEEPTGPRETEGDDEKSSSKEEETFKEDITVVLASTAAEARIQSPKTETKHEDVPQTKGIDSPRKAMVSWISEEVKTEASEVISVTTKEAKEMKAFRALQQTEEIFTLQEERSKPSLTRITVSESSATPLAVVPYKY